MQFCAGFSQTAAHPQGRLLLGWRGPPHPWGVEWTPGTLIRHLPEGQPEKPGIPPLNSSGLGQSLRCSPASSRPQPRLIHNKSHFLEVTSNPALGPFHCPDPSNTLAPKGERSVKPDIQIEICVIFKAADPTLSLEASPSPFRPAPRWATCSLTPAFQRGEQQAGLRVCAPFLSCLGGPWLPAFLRGIGSLQHRHPHGGKGLDLGLSAALRSGRLPPESQSLHQVTSQASESSAREVSL